MFSLLVFRKQEVVTVLVESIVVQQVLGAVPLDVQVEDGARVLDESLHILRCEVEHDPTINPGDKIILLESPCISRGLLPDTPHTEPEPPLMPGGDHS